MENHNLTNFTFCATPLFSSNKVYTMHFCGALHCPVIIATKLLLLLLLVLLPEMELGQIFNP